MMDRRSHGATSPNQPRVETSRGRRIRSWRVPVIVAVVGSLSMAALPAVEARPPRAARARAGAPQATPALLEPKAFVLMDAASGRVLEEKEPHLPWPPASMTKMMLMLIVAERVRAGDMTWDDRIRASRWASKMGGSQVYLREGEEFSLGEMMQAIIIHSANDASVAVAEAVAGSTDAFVDLMNERAARLGLRDTTYRSPHGLPPAPGQEADMTSAHDLAQLGRELLKHPEIMQWAGTAEAPFRAGEFKLVNTNHLVRNTSWVDGIKTGYYRDAGFNVTATGERNGLRLIAVVLGVPDKKRCFDETARLLNRGFASYKTVFAVRKGDVIASDVPVKSGKSSFVRVVAGGDVAVLTEKNENRRFNVELALSGELQAPLAAAAPVGLVIVREDAQEVGKVPALAADAVERAPSLWERWF